MSHTLCFVPNWIGHKKSPASGKYRYLALREALQQEALAGMEDQLPFPTMESHQRRYKLFGISLWASGRQLPGQVWHGAEQGLDPEQDFY